VEEHAAETSAKEVGVEALEPALRLDRGKGLVFTFSLGPFSIIGCIGAQVPQQVARHRTSGALTLITENGHHET